MFSKIWLILFLGGSILAVGEPLPSDFHKTKPKLVLVLVIDQFRADYLERFRSRFLPAKSANGSLGGFQYLMAEGAYYPQAQFDLLQNMTGPGHSQILSGSYPYQNGIALNRWYDKATGEKVYCSEDDSHATLGDARRGTHLGTSPRNFIGTTVGDELKNAGHASKVVTISIKDRAAIFMGGYRADAAFWMDRNHLWTSSHFYFPDGKLPSWLVEHNGANAKASGKWEWKSQQSAPGTATGMSSGDPTFSHEISLGTKEDFSSPVGLELTESFAELAFTQYSLGKGTHPDLLAVSFSSHDYVGHAYGPNSQEMEEMTVSDDKSIAKLLNFVNKKVSGGLKNVLVVLTADHGIPPTPEFLKKNRISSERLDEKKTIEDVESYLRGKIGKSPEDDRWLSCRIYRDRR